jgi:N-acetylglucosaminyldiphosphoundecaprenol N-acetyl-beta-D-mannosaminyltransferase
VLLDSDGQTGCKPAAAAGMALMGQHGRAPFPFATYRLMTDLAEIRTPDMTPPPTDAAARRVRMFGIAIDAVTMAEAIERLIDWLDESTETCRFVVTPNVDHVVVLQTNESLRRVYDDAHLILADGLPLIAASRLLGDPLPERVAGSELVPLLFDAVPMNRRLRVFLLGAAPGVGERAAANIAQRWPGIQIVGTYSPPLGFERDADEEQRIQTRLTETAPELVVVGLGAPKQELWVHRHYRHLPGRVALCVGATIDFLAGEKPQAPVWMRRTGLEWLHRAITEPRRLGGRYAKDAWIFPQLVWREWRAQSR